MTPASPRPVALVPTAASGILLTLLLASASAGGIAASPPLVAQVPVPLSAAPSGGPVPASPASLLEGLLDAVPAAARPGVAAALERQAGAVAAVEDLAAAPTLEATLRAAVAQDPEGRFAPSAIPPLPSYASLGEALAALGAAAGHPLAPADALRAAAFQASLPLPLQEAIRILASHMVVALQLQERALAPVGAADLAFLKESIRAASRPDPAALAARLEAMETGGEPGGPLEGLGVDGARFRQAAARVDFGAMAAGGAVALRGVDQALPALRTLHGMPTPPALAAGTLAPPPAGACAGLAGATLVVPGILLVGFGGPEAYGTGAGTDVLLSIDLGGDDAYCNNAGSTQASGGDPLTGAAACTPAIPIGILIDVGGDDAYHSTYGGPGGANTDDTSAASVECFEGAGAVGIGVLVDLTGDDGYNSWKVLDDTGNGQCPLPPTATGGVGASLIDTASQGFGGLGVGVLADLGGDDAYSSYNTLCSIDVTTLHGIQTQGAAMAGIGIAVDHGAGRNAWGSFNAQHNFGALGNNHFTFLQQGAATVGVGVLLSREAVDDYLTGNTADAPGAVGWSVWELSNAEGSGALAGAGLLADPSGNDRYLCANQHWARESSVFSFNDHQGSASTGVGTLADLDGDDCYDSLNFGSSGGTSWMAARRAQGFATLGGAGALVDLGGRQDFASGNTLVGGAGGLFLGAALVPAATWLDLEGVQGAATADASVGVLVVANAAAGDRYASGNAQSSTPGDEAATIVTAQGSGGSTTGTALGVLIDADLGAADSYASDNVANGGAGSSAGIVLHALQGASNAGGGLLASLLPPLGGTSVFVDTGGADRYSSGNVYAPFAAPFGCAPFAFPFSAGASCIDWSNGQSKGPPGVFVDLAVPAGPDTHFPGPYNSYGLGMYGGAPLGGLLASVCVDAPDGPDVPLPVVGGPCLDL